MAKLSIYDLTHIITRYRPKSREDFADFGINLRLLDWGAFREVFEVIGYNLVVKMPGDTDFSDDGEHSLVEYNAYKKIKLKSKYKPLRPYLPEIYCCSKDGVILMRKYSKKGRRIYYSQLIDKIADKCFPDEMVSLDIFVQNLGFDKKGRPKILDFGCFPEDM